MSDYQVLVVCNHCGRENRVLLRQDTTGKASCGYCRRQLMKVIRIEGYVYVLSHPSMPNLLKIGMTTKSVEERARSLAAATSLPGPFKIEAYFPTEFPQKHEKAVHEVLKTYREFSKREFFRISVDEALHWMRIVCGLEPTIVRGGKPNNR